ncbi:hypothetical protein BDV95DRAFT_667185 [Massariosphaeria phaeospora]|uniref:Uncharacterized protein n=1 Tax=Massariosphaeria phaeospora TaxID=100035 RepID=A0A7C8ME92_9PLEO|nr:hypothetical protein BDV95DRAFT_667185 [Massariosphaeria phaeospora]
MLALPMILALPVLLSTSIFTHAFATDQGFIDIYKGANAHYAAELTGGEDCNEKEMQKIRDGFVEMNMLFQAAVNVNWDGVPEREFFGSQERIQNYTRVVEANLRRAAQYANLKGNVTRNPDIHVRCDDPNDQCGGKGWKRDGNGKGGGGGGHAAYNIGNEPHINFCGRDNDKKSSGYFDLDPLDERMEKKAGKNGAEMELDEYQNRATAWARQVMHISAVGTAIVEKAVPNTAPNGSEWVMSTSEGPMGTSVLAGVQNERPETDFPNDIQQLKYAYGATRAKIIAASSIQEPYDAINNAESYALYSQARYLMEKKNFYPNLPVLDIGDEIALLNNEELQGGKWQLPANDVV